jgi:hypothetical protein
MPAHFARFTPDGQSAGVILLREAIPISTAINELFSSGMPAMLKNGPTDSCGFRSENILSFATHGRVFRALNQYMDYQLGDSICISHLRYAVVEKNHRKSSGRCA